MLVWGVTAAVGGCGVGGRMVRGSDSEGSSLSVGRGWPWLAVPDPSVFLQSPRERVFLGNSLVGLLTASCVTTVCCEGPLSLRRQGHQGVALVRLTAQLEHQERSMSEGGRKTPRISESPGEAEGQGWGRADEQAGRPSPPAAAEGEEGRGGRGNEDAS